jgi:hypothetical protein
MNKFNSNDKRMAENIVRTLRNIQTLHFINFDKEVEWLRGLNERFGEGEEEDPTSESDAVYFWDM